MKTKIESELNKLTKVLENPIRRKIIERLSHEPSYSLRLSKQLGLSQQLITKHLNVMTKAGVVKSTSKNSPKGAKRKIFALARNFSIIIDVAPHLFKEELITFDAMPEEYDYSNKIPAIVEKRDIMLDDLQGKDKMTPFSALLREIDENLELLEKERAVLLLIRNSVMMDASKVIQNIDDVDSRLVLHSALDEHKKSVKSISKSLNLREDKVRQIIRKLKDDLKTAYFE